VVAVSKRNKWSDLINIIREASRIFRKREESLKDNINELATNNKDKTFVEE
jgi:hypothetical protein